MSQQIKIIIMNKQDYERAKSKELQIESLLKQKKAIECGKIVSLKIRVFDNDKINYEEIILTDIPKKEIKRVFYEDVERRLETAKNDYDSFFD